MPCEGKISLEGVSKPQTSHGPVVSHTDVSEGICELTTENMGHWEPSCRGLWKSDVAEVSEHRTAVWRAKVWVRYLFSRRLVIFCGGWSSARKWRGRSSLARTKRSSLRES